MTVSENICPICKTKNDLEAVTCLHCGATLNDPFLDPGAKTKTTDMPAIIPENIRAWSIDEAAVGPGGIAVYVEGEYKPAYISFNGEFIIGRKMGTTGTPSEVLLDLAPLGAYHMGLSRRHAVVRRLDQGYEVMDLGSVNGSWLNDERLIPHKPYPLASGSHLRLGRMRLLVLYRPFPETKQKL